MKGIFFSGPQHWDYFESGMSSVKVHSSRATAKHIDIEPYSLYTPLNPGNIMIICCLGKGKKTHSHGISDSNIFQAFLDEYLQPDEKKKNHLHNPKLPWVTFKPPK